MTQHGKVYLVGAGPGRTEYLTLQARQRLAAAEVLIYDALVDEALLSLVPDGCLRVDVGKRGGGQSTPQAEINRLLVDYCLQGKRVVRLKSGDPFIFGRCTAEIGALRDRHCDFEVVPGLSSALAAPLLAHIPLTDPVLSRCFAVVSAHEPDALNWEALSLLDTVVILMGGRQLEEIVHQLGKHGRSPQTPVAVIRWGGHPEQQVWTGTLATILHETAHQSLSPAVIVVGDVVRLRPYLEGNAPLDASTADENSHPLDLPPDLPPERSTSPVISAPLAGKTVLVTRAAGQTGQFTALLAAQGARVVEMPVLEIGPPSSWAALDGAIADLSRFDWLILTSTNGVEYFFERLLAMGHDARALAGLKIAVVGQKTAQVLQQHGIRADFIPPNFVADSLVETFPVSPMAGLNILFPRVETGGRE
ncbi:MAG TPA: uroporphyrinogen-III C-methyltransferase, partial [Chroococcidiopsis sp.]